MEERVDKNWMSKGIDLYSTEAIVGTLAHYGVAIDEEKFKRLSSKGFPIGIAHVWSEAWKGTGQFARFPYAAAEELWRRLCPGEIVPIDVALALEKLLVTLTHISRGEPDDGTLETRFAVIQALASKFPVDATRREAFEGEMMLAFEQLEVPDMGPLTKALVGANQVDVARRFAKIQEAILPVRQGIMTALVLAWQGDSAPAIDLLDQIAQNSAHHPSRRVGAMSALIELNEVQKATAIGMTLLDEAGKSKNLALAAEVVEELSDLLDESLDEEESAHVRLKIASTVEALRPHDA